MIIGFDLSYPGCLGASATIGAGLTQLSLYNLDTDITKTVHDLNRLALNKN